MSITYDLVCNEMRLRMWVGQGAHFSSFYTGDELVMEDLHDFLKFTQGKSIKLLNEFDAEYCYLEDPPYNDFLEFKVLNPQIDWIYPRGVK